MTWRRQPPVLSRVSARGLAAGFNAAIGIGRDARSEVESVLCRRYGAMGALGTGSGTSALILALRKVVPAGGTIAYPGYGCIDLTACAVAADVRVRLYDLDPATLSPDLDSIRAVLERGVDAILVAHLYGYPADVNGVSKIAAEYGIPVIEDAAQGAGGRLGGVRLGGLADLSVLSFARGKGMTGGSGGALLVRNSFLAQWIKDARVSLAPPSRTGIEVVSLLAQRLFAHPTLYHLPAALPGLKLGEMVYRPPAPPRAMSAASAAVLKWNLQDEEEESQARRLRAERVLEEVRLLRGIRPIRPVEGGVAGYLRLPIIDAAGSLGPHPQLGILRGYPTTLDRHAELGALLRNGERAGTGCQLLRDSLLTIPTHWHFSPSDLNSLWRIQASQQDSSRVAAFT